MQKVNLSKVTIFNTKNEMGHNVHNWYINVNENKIVADNMQDFFYYLRKDGIELVDDLGVYSNMDLINISVDDFEKIIISTLNMHKTYEEEGE